MEIFPGISMDPSIRFGKPCLTGTRIDVATVVGALASGESIEVGAGCLCHHAGADFGSAGICERGGLMSKATVKEEMKKMLESLPEDCTWEDIQYHIYVREKIERGVAAVDAGDIISQEEAEKRVDQWLKLSGQDRR